MTLVFFLGGVTYAEISALRYLSAREDSMWREGGREGGREGHFKMLCGAGLMEYSVGSTHIINSVSLISSVMEDTPLYQPVRTLWDSDSPTSSGSGRAPPPQDNRYIYSSDTRF